MARIEITAKSDAESYWVAIDGHDVAITNGVGQDDLKPGKHMLYWGLQGAAGNKLSITLQEGPTVICLVKESRIPKDEELGGGLKRFVVGGA
jgi:hypothetical protein